MRTLGFRGKKSRLCGEWGTRRDLVWGKLGKGESIGNLGRCKDLFQGNELRFFWAGLALGTWFLSIYTIWVTPNQCVNVIQWLSFTWLQGKKGAWRPVEQSVHQSVLLEQEPSTGSWDNSSKGTGPRGLWGSGWPLHLSREYCGLQCWKVPQRREMGTRTHAGPGPVVDPKHQKGTRKFWRRCFRERGNVGPSFRALLAQVHGWYSA